MTWGRQCWRGRSPALVPRAPGLPLGPGPRLDLDDLPALAGLDLPAGPCLGGRVRCSPVAARRAGPLGPSLRPHMRLAPINVCHLSLGLEQEALWILSGPPPPGARLVTTEPVLGTPPPTARTPIVASLDPLLCNWDPQAPQPRVASKPLGAGRRTPRAWRRLLAPP